MKRLRRTPISCEAYDAIIEHQSELIKGMEGALEQYKNIRKADRPPFVEKQIHYWKSAIAALKWSNRLAAQRAGVQHDK